MAKVYVVGSGPNGLSAGLHMARNGHEVTVFEKRSTPGGGARTEEVTLPGFHHDICSAVHPTARISPFFREIGLDKKVNFITPEISFAQAITPEKASFAYKDMAKTASSLGKDEQKWLDVFAPLANNINQAGELFLDPLINIGKLKSLRMGSSFALNVLKQGGLEKLFKTEEAKSLIAGVEAHALTKLPSLSASMVGLSLTSVSQSKYGWPIVEGGSQKIIDALIEEIINCGGNIECDVTIDDKSQLKDADIVFLDTTPKEFQKIYGHDITSRSSKFTKKFKYHFNIKKPEKRKV